MAEQAGESNNKVDMDIIHAAIDKVLAYGPSRKQRKPRKGIGNGPAKEKTRKRSARRPAGPSNSVR